MKKYEIRADTWKNRLYLVLSGFFDDDEVREVTDKVIQEMKKLRPGFDIINDISDFKPTTQQGAEEIKRAQIFAKRAGVDRIIRIVPSVTLGAMQFTRTSRETGYAADTASSLEEAEKMLGTWWLKPMRRES